MSLLIKNWSKADWKELLEWAKIGANNAMIGEYAEVEELQPHGRLIDADELCKTLRSFPENEYTPEVFANWIENHIDAIIPAGMIPYTDESWRKTNGDRIRAMTDEKLANWYFDKFFPCVPYCSVFDECPEHDDCKICLLEWLKQESEDT